MVTGGSVAAGTVSGGTVTTGTEITGTVIGGTVTGGTVIGSVMGEYFCRGPNGGARRGRANAGVEAAAATAR